jgi:CheY-like chemotaxis protein
VLPLVTDIPLNALIVVVDDNVFERMGASGMFVDAGYRVLEAGDADEALRFFETNADIRLIFTDVSMPGSMSGLDLAHQVAERWPEVGIIVTSGRPRPLMLPLSMLFHEKPAGARLPAHRGKSNDGSTRTLSSHRMLPPINQRLTRGFTLTAATSVVRR